MVCRHLQRLWLWLQKRLLLACFRVLSPQAGRRRCCRCCSELVSSATQLAGCRGCRTQRGSLNDPLCYLLHVLHRRCCCRCLLMVGIVGGVRRHSLLLAAVSLRQLVVPLALCRHHICHSCQQRIWQLFVLLLRRRLLLYLLLRCRGLGGLCHSSVGGVDSS